MSLLSLSDPFHMASSGTPPVRSAAQSPRPGPRRSRLLTEQELNDDSWAPEVMGSGQPGLTKEQYLRELEYIKTRLAQDREREEASRIWDQEMANFIWKRRCSLVFSILLHAVIVLLLLMFYFHVADTMHPLCVHDRIPGLTQATEERCWQFGWDAVMHAVYLPVAVVATYRESKILWHFGVTGLENSDSITPALQGFLMLFSIMIWTIHFVVDQWRGQIAWTQGVSVFPLAYCVFMRIFHCLKRLWSDPVMM
jgi:hypothetical protein